MVLLLTTVNDGDMTIEKQGVALVVDPMSLQYLVGGSVDYTEGLEGSRFVVTNPMPPAPAGVGLRSVFKRGGLMPSHRPSHREREKDKTVTLRLPFCVYLPFSSSANVGNLRCQRIAARRIASVTTIPSMAEFSSGIAKV